MPLPSRFLWCVWLSVVVAAGGCGGSSGGTGAAGHDGGAGHDAAGASGTSSGGAGAAGGGTAGVDGGAAGVAGATAGAGGGGGGMAGAAGADAGNDVGAGGAVTDGGGQDADARDASAGDVPAAADSALDTLTPDGDANGADGASPFAHGPANLCGSAASTAPPIQQTVTTATYQDTAAGGQITPGMYWMTSETLFTPAVAAQLSDTLYFYGDGTFQEVQIRGGNTSLIGGTWAIVGTTLQMHATCPSAVSISFRITATDSTLTVFYDPNMLVAVYTRK